MILRAAIAVGLGVALRIVSAIQSEPTGIARMCCSFDIRCHAGPDSTHGLQSKDIAVRLKEIRPGPVRRAPILNSHLEAPTPHLRI